MNLENDFAKLVESLAAQHEWLLVHPTGKSFAVNAREIDIQLKANKILFGFPDEKGFQTWRVASFKNNGSEIILNLARNFEREKEKIRLVPRVSVGELTAAVELARLEKANEIARLIVAQNERAKLVEVELNGLNGRLAQIVFQTAHGRQIAALSDVSGAAVTHESLLTFALLWLADLQARKKKPIETVWILADKKRSKNLQKLRALLRPQWQNKIEIFEISGKNAALQSAVENDENQSLKRLGLLDFSNLFGIKPKKIEPSANIQISRTAREIIAVAPAEIDVVSAKHGETVRFCGLPFARVRSVSGAEKVWFGIENKRQLLTKNNLAEFSNLIEELEIHRRFDAPNKRHALFRLAPEAWLEAVLRRNIKLLDANLVLSPVHNQFRAGRDKIDLLALRRDGRLVVVELKVAPDREMIFQAADYWRKIEAERRGGNLQTAKIFGDLEIADTPPLVYLVAPLFSFHRDFDFFARTITKEIEIYRFDLNENWRENLKVVRRGKINN